MAWLHKLYTAFVQHLAVAIVAEQEREKRFQNWKKNHTQHIRFVRASMILEGKRPLSSKELWKQSFTTASATDNGYFGRSEKSL